MTKTIDGSDLLDWAHHDHEHLDKLFLSLHENFDRIEVGDQEALAQALDDLEGALEDMLEHFNEEEEVYFVAIERHFPESAGSIEKLVAAHEDICNRTRKLRAQLAQPTSSLADIMDVLHEELRLLSEALSVHNAMEQQVFQDALEGLSEQEREALLHRKLSLG